MYKRFYIVSATLGLGGLYVCNERTSKRLGEELPYLRAMLVDATTQAVIASDEGHFSVRNTEKRIFEIVCGEIQWNIDQREQYLSAPPVTKILHVLLPPCNAKDTMNYVFMNVAMIDDGDYYDSYLDFVHRH